VGSPCWNRAIFQLCQVRCQQDCLHENERAVHITKAPGDDLCIMLIMDIINNRLHSNDNTASNVLLKCGFANYIPTSAGMKRNSSEYKRKITLHKSTKRGQVEESYSSHTTSHDFIKYLSWKQILIGIKGGGEQSDFNSIRKLGN